MPIERLTPKSLYDIFVALTGEDQRAFLELLANFITAEDYYAMLGFMSYTRSKQFTELFEEQLWHATYPDVLRAAVRLAMENPKAAEKELMDLTHEEVSRRRAEEFEEMRRLERATLKEGRDRKPDPETIVRNVEICDLRKGDPKKWSHSRLAKKFGVTTRAIRKILADELKWRGIKNRGG